MRLTKSSNENTAVLFAASVISLVRVQASTFFGECYSWPSHLQADLAAACRRDTNLGT